jgi:hypothetical protein
MSTRMPGYGADVVQRVLDQVEQHEQERRLVAAELEVVQHLHPDPAARLLAVVAVLVDRLAHHFGRRQVGEPGLVERPRAHLVQRHRDDLQPAVDGLFALRQVAVQRLDVGRRHRRHLAAGPGRRQHLLHLLQAVPDARQRVAQLVRDGAGQRLRGAQLALGLDLLGGELEDVGADGDDHVGRQLRQQVVRDGFAGVREAEQRHRATGAHDQHHEGVAPVGQQGQEAQRHETVGDGGHPAAALQAGVDVEERQAVERGHVGERVVPVLPARRPEVLQRHHAHREQHAQPQLEVVERLRVGAGEADEVERREGQRAQDAHVLQPRRTIGVVRAVVLEQALEGLHCSAIMPCGGAWSHTACSTAATSPWISVYGSAPAGPAMSLTSTV